VKRWDPVAGQHLGTTKLGSDWVEHLAWVAATPPAPGTTAGPARLFAAAGRALTALAADGTVIRTFPPAAKTLTALAAHPRGGALAAACYGGVSIWDADDGLRQKELVYQNGIHALVWSPDGRWLVSGNQDPSVHLWIPEQDLEFHMSGYEGKVKFLAFDYSSRWLATSGGRDACVWDCAGAGPEGREPVMLPHEAPVCAVRFQNTHGLLATGSADGAVQLWSPERRQPLRATVRMPSPATRLAWSPDDAFLAIGTERGAVYVLACRA
jgi:WD40 repeat protein